VEARPRASRHGRSAVFPDGLADLSRRRPLDPAANTAKAGHVVTDNVLAVHLDAAKALACWGRLGGPAQSAQQKSTGHRYRAD
jgi:hypothetical protein